MKRRDLEQMLTQLGWALKREGGKHSLWQKGGYSIAVPRHRELRKNTAKSILKQAERVRSSIHYSHKEK